MTQQGVQLNQEQFCCSICLHLLKDPVTVPCGHNYCSRCIDGYWNQGVQRGRFSCPQCRQMFIPRPVLKKNNMLAEVVDRLKETDLKAAPPDHDYAGPGDVACDVCNGRKLKAVKTCLQCLVSYCDTHLQPHYRSPAFKKHKLVKSSSQLQENICSRHDEVRKVFCRNDQLCICYLCSMEEHKGHDMTSAAAERSERQKELDTSQHGIHQRIQEREKDVKVLHHELESINKSADRAAEDSDTIFSELITSIETRRSEVKELIRDQQKRDARCAEERRRRVEQEVTELRRRHAELEQLSRTEDHIQFLRRYNSLSTISESTHPVSSNVRPLSYFEDVTVAVSKMRDKLDDILKEEGTMVSMKVNRVDVLALKPPVPKTKAEFLQYSCPITLDINTANQYLSLTKENRKVISMNEQQMHRHHSERFSGGRGNAQVLSREGLTGRCYLEVEWKGYAVDIALAYKDISRKNVDLSIESSFGFNDKSWSLRCFKEGYEFIHKESVTKISVPVSSRVGVYLDHSAGTLSFYNVSDTMMTLIPESRPRSHRPSMLDLGFIHFTETLLSCVTSGRSEVRVSLS